MSRTSNATFFGRSIVWLKERKSLSLRDHYQRELYFVAVLGLSAFYYTALVSYQPTDPSPLSLSFPESTVENLAGQIGAIISGFSIFLVGLGAFLLPLPFLLTAIMVLVNVPRSFSKTRVMGFAGAFVGITTTLAILLNQTKLRGFEVPAGGLLGERISHVLLNALGELGTLIAVCTLLIGSLIAITRKGLISQASAFLLARLKSWRLPRIIPFRKSHRSSAELQAAPSEVSLPPLVIRSARPLTDSKTTPVTEHLPELNLHLDEPIPSSFSDSSPLQSETPEHLGSYTPPPPSIFKTSPAIGPLSDQQREEYEQTAKLLTQSFADFSINGSVMAIQPGPVVTVFEFHPDAGTKISRILSLIDDIALALKVDSVLMHPVKGKSAIGVQVPNKSRETVYLGDIVNSKTFRDETSPMTLAMGKSLAGEPVCADLSAMPHLLMAGATGAGKSVAINSLLCSVILKSTPSDVKMILVDPKMLELSMYEDIPHLMMPVITDPKKASSALRWATYEMERRYRLMQMGKVRHIAGFNQFWQKASEDVKDEIRLAMGDDNLDCLPYILLVIDELADLMLTAPKDVEASIQRLAQKARASGIHLVLATQRPSVDIITGVIKANLPCRVAFQTVSKHDSRTILDQVGSEKLLGKGDMLFLKPGTSRLERIQGAFISDEEVATLVETLKKTSKAQYDESVMSWIEREAEKGETHADNDPSECDDPKFDEAVAIAARHGGISASYLQRQLKIGYNRAARIVESMAAQGMVGEADGAKPRRWLGRQEHSEFDGR